MQRKWCSITRIAPSLTVCLKRHLKNMRVSVRRQPQKQPQREYIKNTPGKCRNSGFMMLTPTKLLRLKIMRSCPSFNLTLLLILKRNLSNSLKPIPDILTGGIRTEIAAKPTTPLNTIKGREAKRLCFMLTSLSA